LPVLPPPIVTVVAQLDGETLTRFMSVTTVRPLQRVALASAHTADKSARGLREPSRTVALRESRVASRGVAAKARPTKTEESKVSIDVK
jgi:hypothetical protein